MAIRLARFHLPVSTAITIGVIVMAVISLLLSGSSAQTESCYPPKYTASGDLILPEGWFVMMRDSKGSHVGNKLWGDGWGWSWFDAANPSRTTSTDYKIDC
jgi:hypothetical protein